MRRLKCFTEHNNKTRLRALIRSGTSPLRVVILECEERLSTNTMPGYRLYKVQIEETGEIRWIDPKNIIFTNGIAESSFRFYTNYIYVASTYKEFNEYIENNTISVRLYGAEGNILKENLGIDYSDKIKFSCIGYLAGDKNNNCLVLVV